MRAPYFHPSIRFSSLLIDQNQIDFLLSFFHQVDHADDNGPFGALLVAQYASMANDKDFFCASEPTVSPSSFGCPSHTHLPYPLSFLPSANPLFFLPYEVRAGLDFLNRSTLGLIYNSPVSPNCTYGFTDTIAKTGHELFTSLLYYQACVTLAGLTQEWGCGDSAEYSRRAELIRANLNTLLDADTGLYFAGEIDCRQHDVWGSMFAVYLNLTTPTQAQQIVSFMIENRGLIMQRGQLRHLVAPELWQRCIQGCPAPGTYQNGGFWATPLQWFLPTLATFNTTVGSSLAAEYLRETISDFRANGTAECVNDSYHGVMAYVASSTAAWSAAKALGFAF